MPMDCAILCFLLLALGEGNFPQFLCFCVFVCWFKNGMVMALKFKTEDLEELKESSGTLAAILCTDINAFSDEELPEEEKDGLVEGIPIIVEGLMLKQLQLLNKMLGKNVILN